MNSNSLFNKIFGNKNLNIHFVGIGGVSMNTLALICLHLGHNVSGSDLFCSQNIKELKEKGICVTIGHKKENVNNKDIIIYSYACEKSEEVVFAKSMGIAVYSRSELLGEILKKYKTSICIAGAHGKTTTTALIYCILKNAGLSVDIHLGGKLEKNEYTICDHLNITNNIIVCEACEYKDAFLNLKPTISVVTNIAPEHLDYFKTFENVKNSFNMFSLSASMLICNNLHILENKNTITFGENGDFSAKNIKMNNNGTQEFSCFKCGRFYGRFKLNLIGEYNVLNALASIAIADSMGISKKTIKKTLETFGGVERRFQRLSNKHFIVQDYAHHPDEVKEVIQETLKFYKEKLLVVFQPHTYSRTKNLMNEFIDAFKNIKDVVIYKTYPAREKYQAKGSANLLAKNIGENATYIKNKQKLKQFVIGKINNNYGVLFLGAGNVDILAKNIVKLC